MLRVGTQQGSLPKNTREEPHENRLDGKGQDWGAGIPPESMTLEQFIRDAHEVTQMLKQRFRRSVRNGFKSGMGLEH